MKISKILLTLFILLCTFIPAEAKRQQSDSYKLQYINLEWWENYKDPNLNKYLQMAYINNQDLKIAAIKTKQAEQIVKESFAQELPQLGFQGDLFRDFHSSQIQFGDVIIPNYKQSNFILPLTMTYELDIWGENRLKTKSIKQQMKIIEQDERATYIKLTSALASEYFHLIELDKLIENQDKLLKLQKQIVDMTEKKYKNGLCPVTDLIKERQLLTNFQETYDIYVDRQIIVGRQIAVLVGDRNLVEIERSAYDKLVLVDIPDSIAAECIHNRPDLLKTEEYIKKAGFDVKAARRDFLPKFLLYGQLGFNAYSLGNIFTSQTFKSAAGVMPSLDLFTGGAKLARFRYNKLELEKAQQLYEKTILTSLQEVNNSLGGAITHKKNYQSSLERYNLEKENYRLYNKKLDIGALSKMDDLRAQEAVLISEKEEAVNKVSYIISTINIYKAVGGVDYMQFEEHI